VADVVGRAGGTDGADGASAGGLEHRLRERLADLRQEQAAGHQRLRDLVQQESALRELLLRISGAVQALEEVLDSTGMESLHPVSRGSRGTEAGAAADGTPAPGRTLTVP
jgi:hypothetical protein